MHWTEPATAEDSHAALKPSEYSPTVLGLIFLRYADVLIRETRELEAMIVKEAIELLAA